MKECKNCLFNHSEGRSRCPACGYVEHENKFTHMEFDNEYQYSSYEEFSKAQNKRKRRSLVSIAIAMAFVAIVLFALPEPGQNTQINGFALIWLCVIVFAVVLILAIANVISKIRSSSKQSVKRKGKTEGTIITYKWKPFRRRSRHSLRDSVEFPHYVYPIVEFVVDGTTYRVRSTIGFKGYVGIGTGTKKININIKDKDKNVLVKYDTYDPSNASISYSLKHYKYFIRNRWFEILIIILAILIGIGNHF